MQLPGGPGKQLPRAAHAPTAAEPTSLPCGLWNARGAPGEIFIEKTATGKRVLGPPYLCLPVTHSSWPDLSATFPLEIPKLFMEKEAGPGSSALIPTCTSASKGRSPMASEPKGSPYCYLVPLEEKLARNTLLPPHVSCSGRLSAHHAQLWVSPGTVERPPLSGLL